MSNLVGVLDINSSKDDVELTVQHAKLNSTGELSTDDLYRIGSFELYDKIVLKEDIHILVDDNGIETKNYCMVVEIGNKPVDLYGTALFVSVEKHPSKGYVYRGINTEQLSYIRENVKPIMMTVFSLSDSCRLN